MCHFLYRVDIAEIEPSTRGTKKGQHQKTFSLKETKDADIFDDGVADNEIEIDTTQHGEGLANASRELFSVQHQGSFSGIFLHETLLNFF